jgi:hydroxymethylbilane synthase
VVDATLLAVAGLNRLGYRDRITHILPTDQMLPATAQGAVGIERRAGDDRVAAVLAPLNDGATATVVAAERALLAELDGSCRTPIAGLAVLNGDALTLTALVARPDGSARHVAEASGPAADAAALGREAGLALKIQAAPGFFDFSASETAAR